MAARIQLLLKDTAGAKLALVPDFASLTYTKTVNDQGSFTLVLDGSDPRAALFTHDLIVEIWRSDPEISLDWYKDFDGIILELDKKIAENSDRELSIRGAGLLEILSRRVVLYDQQDLGEKWDWGEKVLKEYVKENAGSEALYSNGRWVDGNIPTLSVEAYHPTLQGDEWTGEMAGSNLLDALKQVAELSNVDFTLEQDPLTPGYYIFKTHYPYGKDLSTAGLSPVTGLNGAGQRPVIFSTMFSNLEDVSYLVSHIGEVNVSVALGQGSSYVQDFEVSENAASITTEISRREGTISAQESELSVVDDELLYAAYMDLINRKAKKVLRFSPLTSGMFHYGKDYNVGDIITVRFDAEDISVHFKSITVTLGEDSQEKIEFAEMEIV